MESFRDERGKQRYLRVDIPALTRIRDELGVDLLEPFADITKVNPDTFARIGRDIPLFLTVMKIAYDEAGEANEKLDNKEFARLFNHDVMRDCVNAFARDWSAFFPNSVRGFVVEMTTSQEKKLEGKLETFMEVAAGKFGQQMDEALEGLTRERMEAILDEALSSKAPPNVELASGKSSTSGAPSPASNPGEG